MLDRQVQILSLDTGNFYSSREAKLHWKNHMLRMERNQLINGYDLKKANGKIKHIVGLKEIEAELNKYGIEKNELSLIEKEEYDFSKHGEDCDFLIALCEQYYYIKRLISVKNKAIKESKVLYLNTGRRREGGIFS